MADELKLFDDLPLFENIEKEKQEGKEEERFGHWAYADALHQILKDNNKSLTIGLFGEWGTGKSTVINILQNKFKEDKDSKIRPVIFNAWRHQDDSFRRQLLIKVAEDVYGKQNSKYKDLTNLVGLSECITEATDEDNSTEKMSWSEVGKQIIDVLKWFIFSSQKSAKLIRIAIIIYVVILVAGIFVSLFGNPEVANFISAALLLPIGLILFGLVEKETKHKLIATLNINQPTTERPRLSYPEQFEMEFIECVNFSNKENNRLVIVVDDLDRCDKNLVIAALATIKQFSGKSNCVFIVPCDEQQVLNAVNAQVSNHDYDYESLRKFFDVAVRMEKIPEADLHNYAKYLVEQWKLAPQLAEIAVYSGARDARKIKAFLNSFNTHYWMIQKRFNPEKAGRNLLLIAKLTAIQEGFPELYKIICLEPLMLNRFENAHKDSSVDSYEKNNVSKEIKDLILKNSILTRFLEYTDNIDLTEIEDLVIGKQLELIAGISTGSIIQTTLSNGKIEEFSEAVKGLDKTQADHLVEYIRLMVKEFEEKKFYVILRMWVNCALGIFSYENIWTNDDLITAKQLLANIIVDAITKEKGKLLKDISNIKGIESILQITSDSTSLANAIVQVYLERLTTDGASSYIGLFNRKKKYFEQKFEGINTAIISALNSENEQLILNQLSIAEIRNDIDDPIPSNTVLNTIVQRLDAKDNAYELNEKRIQVIEIYQTKIDMTGFINKWNELTKKAQSAPIEIEKTNFGLMLNTVNKIGQFDKLEDANLICTPLLQIWAVNGKESTRNELLKTFSLVYPIVDESLIKQVENVIFSWFKARPTGEIKIYLESLTNNIQTTTDKQGFRTLTGLALSLLEQFVEWMKNQVNTYNEKVEEIVNLVVEWSHTLKTETKIYELVEYTIKKANDPSFELWHKKSLGNLCDCLSDEQVQTISQLVMERIEEPQTAKTRRSQLLDILITKLSRRKLTGQDTDRIFGLLWHDDGNMREPICEKFESLKSQFEEDDFKRNISIMAKNISNSTAEKITQKANSLTIILKSPISLKEQDKPLILNMVPLLIHTKNSSKETIGIGLIIVDSLGNSENVSEDIISGLRALSQYGDENIKGKAAELLKKYNKVAEPDGLDKKDKSDV
ncbi:MAG: KAP family NTPase [Planctomycetaceae bacterium]|nr:KAP family NTPase [Planctomycetaceae bacterium]